MTKGSGRRAESEVLGPESEQGAEAREVIEIRARDTVAPTDQDESTHMSGYEGKRECLAS